MLVFSIKNSFVFKKALLWLVLERCQYLFWDSGWANGLLFYHSQLCAIQNASSYVGCIVILSSSFLSESIQNEMLKVKISPIFVETLHKKGSFILRISSVNMIKSAVFCGCGHIYLRNP